MTCCKNDVKQCCSEMAVIAERIWDGTSEHTLKKSAVMVRGTAIEGVCSIDELSAGLEVLDFGADTTLLPGLIDAHVHYSRWMGPAFLAAGVTTIRDVGNDLEFILEQKLINESDFTAGPGIVCCGPILEGPESSWQNMAWSHATQEVLENSICKLAERKVDAIKLYGGLTDEMIAVGIKAAHRHDLPALCDFGMDEPRGVEGICAGADEIEHLTGCPAAWHASHESELDDLISLLREHGVTLMPTLIVWDRRGRLLDLAFVFDTRRKWVHPQYLDIWDNFPDRKMDAKRRFSFQEPLCQMKRFLVHAVKNDIKVGLGTDSPFPNLIPGCSVHDELAMYVDAGLTPVEALKCATSINADILGLKTSIGRIKPGFQADMFVVKGDPTREITDITRVEQVIRNGMILDRQALFNASRKFGESSIKDAITLDLLDYMRSNDPTK